MQFVSAWSKTCLTSHDWARLCHRFGLLKTNMDPATTGLRLQRITIACFPRRIWGFLKMGYPKISWNYGFQSWNGLIWMILGGTHLSLRWFRPCEVVIIWHSLTISMPFFGTNPGTQISMHYRYVFLLTFCVISRLTSGTQGYLRGMWPALLPGIWLLMLILGGKKQ